MNLFALTSTPGQRILRFPLSQALQDDLNVLFTEQLQSFLSGIEEEVDFDGRYIPETDELLVITDFVDVDGLREAVENPIGIEQFDPASHSLASVKAIFTGLQHQGQLKLLIQLFENKRLIANKGMAIFFSGNTFQKMDDAGLTLDSKLLAVIEGTTLKFQSFHYVRRVFDLSDHYNEATNEDITTFAQHEKLHVTNLETFILNSNSQVRKKVSLILQSGILEIFTSQQIIAAAQSFNINIPTTPDDKIILPENRAELRRLLRFLDEDYYESPLTQTHFISNSKRVAD